jgi:hypothetical protein
LEEGFQVHHINGDHSDNAPENLVLIEALDHLRMHGIFGLKIFSSKRMSQIGSVGGLKSAAIAAKKRARSEINRANALKRYRKSSGDAAA